MKSTLTPGMETTFSFTVPPDKTVPHLYPEAPEFRSMPEVFATGFFVGLIEWTALKVLEPHLEEGEISLGVHIDISHSAATPPGLTVTVKARVTAVEKNRVTFEVEAHDGIDMIGAGRHLRAVVKREAFETRARRKFETAALESR